MNMKHLMLSMVLVFLGTGPSVGYDEPFECFSPVASPSKESARAVESATTVFREKNFGWQNYKTKVEESKLSWLVEFWQPEKEASYTWQVTGPDYDCHTGRWESWHPPQSVTTVDRVDSFQVKVNKRSLRAVWNSIDRFN
jgi:hypothetical protein